MAKSSVSLKLVIDPEAKKVVFAEADNDFVNFLVHILSLPVAKVISLLGKEGMVGSLPNLYQALQDLPDSYILPNKNKNYLLKPVPSVCVPLLAINEAPSGTCPSCRRIMAPIFYIGTPPPAVQQHEEEEEGGLVKGTVKYMVMDDLVVKPMSTSPFIALIKSFNVKDVSALEEKVVDLGITEAVKLLKASLETKNVLTHVFLKGLRSPTASRQCDHETDLMVRDQSKKMG